MVSQIITFMDIEYITRRYEISLRVLSAQRTSEIFFKFLLHLWFANYYLCGRFLLNLWWVLHLWLTFMTFMVSITFTGDTRSRIKRKSIEV